MARHLESEVEQLALLQELVRELAQRVDGVHGEVVIGVLTNLGEEVAEHLPDARPDEAHAASHREPITHEPSG